VPRNQLSDLVGALRQAFSVPGLSKPTTLATTWERPPLQTDLVLEGIPLQDFLVVKSPRTLPALRGVFEEFAELYLVGTEPQEESPAAFVGRRLELTKGETSWLLPDESHSREAIHRAFVIMMWVISNSPDELEASIDTSSVLVACQDFTIGVKNGVLQSKFLQGRVIELVDYPSLLENYHAGITTRSRDRGMSSLWRSSRLLPPAKREAVQMGLRIMFFMSGQKRDTWAYLHSVMHKRMVKKGLKPALREIADTFGNMDNPMKALHDKLVTGGHISEAKFFKMFPESKTVVSEVEDPLMVDADRLNTWYKTLRQKIRLPNATIYE
jgi:hypothetical protein